jgi:SNF2 family DNA or RNA helicase
MKDSISIIESFKKGNISILILSYEMFKKHNIMLNSISALYIMVCDEGHRLKNSKGSISLLYITSQIIIIMLYIQIYPGTQTIAALKNCNAKLRLLLSATIIQNDLNELYSCVSFVCPGYLGSLVEFKNNMANAIVKGNEQNANLIDKKNGQIASNKLKKLLSKIMLRRTQEVMDFCIIYFTF